MKVIIQSPGFKAQKALTDHIQAHVEKLGSFSDRIHDARICLKLDSSDTQENKVCEIKLGIPGNDLFAAKQSRSFEDAFQQTLDAIRAQLAHWKDSRAKRHVTPE